MVAPSPPLTIADEGQRLRRLTRVLFAAVWVVPAGLSALQFAFVGDASGTHYDMGTALLWQGTAWMIWGLWSQVILTLVDRVKLDTARLMPWLSLHLAATAVVCAANVLTIAWLDHLFGAIGQVTSYRYALRVAVVNHLDIQVVLYWAILGAAYMVEFVRRYRERDRAATELEQKLARTQLEALRMQLNPHFLFNALNSVAELMEMDVREAQRTLTRVADLLRLSLRSAGQSLIPVWQEIELVELYLQIARVRYGSELDADISVDPSVSGPHDSEFSAATARRERPQARIGTGSPGSGHRGPPRPQSRQPRNRGGRQRQRPEWFAHHQRPLSGGRALGGRVGHRTHQHALATGHALRRSLRLPHEQSHHRRLPRGNPPAHRGLIEG